MLTEVAAARLDGRLASATPLPGGLTSQRVERLALEDGRRCVLKAAPPGSKDDIVRWRHVLQDEIDGYTLCPELNPWRPRSLEVFEHDGWLVWLLEDVGVDRPPHAVTARGLAELHAVEVARRPPAPVHADHWARVSRASGADSRPRSIRRPSGPGSIGPRSPVPRPSGATPRCRTRLFTATCDRATPSSTRAG